MVLDAILAILLPLFWGIDGVWAFIVVVELMTVVFSAMFMILKRKKYHY